MTREELKREAKEYADKYGNSNFDLWDTARFAYYQGAEPREKQIAELTEQNTSLLTSVENLNKSVQKLEKENAELEILVQKMKCCENCKHHSFWGDELKCNLMSYDAEFECLKTKSKWELAERVNNVGSVQ